MPLTLANAGEENIIKGSLTEQNYLCSVIYIF